MYIYVDQFPSLVSLRKYLMRTNFRISFDIASTGSFWFSCFHFACMASLSVNMLQQIMRAMKDKPGFDRVLGKVSSILSCQHHWNDPSRVCRSWGALNVLFRWRWCLRRRARWCARCVWPRSTPTASGRCTAASPPHWWTSSPPWPSCPATGGRPGSASTWTSRKFVFQQFGMLNTKTNNNNKSKGVGCLFFEFMDSFVGAIFKLNVVLPWRFSVLLYSSLIIILFVLMKFFFMVIFFLSY